MGFVMPMLKPWVPLWLGLPLYFATVFSFQFSSGIYLGAFESYRGATGFMIEDIQYLLYANLAGMAVMFPMLFKMKFRFTNQQLLCGAAALVGICNAITMSTDNMAILIPVCFLEGMGKLQGTFEVMSNIQLWHNPTRDMGKFFPLLHIFLLTAIIGAQYMAAMWAYYMSWKMMHVWVIGTMCVVILIQQIFCRPFCPMPERQSLRGTDWPTALMVCIAMLLLTAILVYGDHLMWFRSPKINLMFGAMLMLLGVIAYRVKTLKHPYLEFPVLRYHYVIPVFIVVMIAELLMGAEYSLEEILYCEVVKLSDLNKTYHELFALIGCYAGIGFCFLWFRYGKIRTQYLMAVDFACIFAYAFLMYTRVDVITPIEHYHLAMACRGAALAITGIGLMWKLEHCIPSLPHFFMGLMMFNIIHMYLGGAESYGVYTTAFKHLMTEDMFRYNTMNATAMMTVAIKQIYGWICWGALVMTIAALVQAWWVTLHSK